MVPIAHSTCYVDCQPLLIITHGKVHDVHILDQLIFEPGAFYIIDRGYLDFDRLYGIHQASAFYVIRAKSNFRFKRLIFLTNNFTLTALTIAELFRCRWQIELFFKWIKQHLRIKAFYGTTENAVKTQIWIAIAVYVLVAIVKKQLHLDLSLYTILQILSVTLFEKTPILEALSIIQPQELERVLSNQLTLFD